MKDKRILTIQDISCVGQCSLTVALPIISACGIETAILPSAVLSTHTGGFKGYTFRDLSGDMLDISNHWKSEGIRFDAVYTGYLGSIDQIEYVKKIMDDTLTQDGLRIVDPAMADNGRLYYGFTEEFAHRMGGLCGIADIALPNITEACFMTDTPYDGGPKDQAYVKALLDKVSGLGAKCVVLKGISFEPDRLGVAVRQEGKTSYYFHEKMPRSFHGTGDCYAAAFTGALMQGNSVCEAAGAAADFIVECIRKTIGDDSHWYGVKFEKALPGLVKRVNRG